MQPAQSALPYHTPALQVGLVTDATSFAALRAEWDDLLTRSEAGVFNSWEWLYPWYRRLGSARKLYILTTRDHEGRLLGIVPLCLQRRRVLGRAVRRLAFLGETEVCGDYLDVIAAPEDLGRVVEASVAYLVGARTEWDVLDLADMDEQAPALPLLKQCFASSGFHVEQATCSVCPTITFPPDATFDGFLRESGRRENYTRRRKWLEKQPGFSIECEENPAELALPFSEFLRLHQLRWRADGGSDGIAGPQVEAFHRDATTLLAERGKLQLYTMKVENRTVAALYGIRHKDTFSYYQAGRDPEWNNRSVGLVLLVETFKRSLESGVRVYDFLRGEEPYKADWNNSSKHTVRLRIYRANGVGMSGMNWRSQEGAEVGAGAWAVVGAMDREEALYRKARKAGKRLLNWTKGIIRAGR